MNHYVQGIAALVGAFLSAYAFIQLFEKECKKKFSKLTIPFWGVYIISFFAYFLYFIVTTG